MKPSETHGMNPCGNVDEEPRIELLIVVFQPILSALSINYFRKVAGPGRDQAAAPVAATGGSRHG
jgi:hypothetical protein